MASILLIVAGLFETGWAIALKQSDGLSRLRPTLVFVAALAVSMVLLGLALRSLPVGAGYAVWTGIGAVGAAIVGVIRARRAGDGRAPRSDRPGRGRHRLARARRERVSGPSRPVATIAPWST
jgi:quaternary ammonium compound-resistance protein SugE